MRFSSIATKPYNIPVAANVNATGKPNSKNAIRLKNIIGARFAIMKSIIRLLVEHVDGSALVFLPQLSSFPRCYCPLFFARHRHQTKDRYSAPLKNPHFGSSEKYQPKLISQTQPE